MMHGNAFDHKYEGVFLSGPHKHHVEVKVLDGEQRSVRKPRRSEKWRSSLRLQTTALSPWRLYHRLRSGSR
jgi:hypothetical protein